MHTDELSEIERFAMNPLMHARLLSDVLKSSIVPYRVHLALAHPMLF